MTDKSRLDVSRSVGLPSDLIANLTVVLDLSYVDSARGERRYRHVYDLVLFGFHEQLQIGRELLDRRCQWTLKHVKSWGTGC